MKITIPTPFSNIDQDIDLKNVKINYAINNQPKQEQIAVFFDNILNRISRLEESIKNEPVHKLDSFNEIWEYQQGALFLKEENSSLGWKKKLAEFFFKEGIKQEMDKNNKLSKALQKCKEQRDSWARCIADNDQDLENCGTTLAIENEEIEEILRR